jgi:hypothetical protein
MNKITTGFCPDSLEKIVLKGEKITLSDETKKAITDCFDFLKDFSSNKIIT